MGHYDECREGYCPSCGAAPGNIISGLCEFCNKPKKSLQVATPWFEPNIKPVHVGPYQILLSLDDELFVVYSYWSGKHWSYTDNSVDAVIKHTIWCRYSIDEFGEPKLYKWRGILK